MVAPSRPLLLSNRQKRKRPWSFLPRPFSRFFSTSNSVSDNHLPDYVRTVYLAFELVEFPSPKTNTSSSLELKIKAGICTSPLYRNEAWLKQKYLVENLPARQIAVLIRCSHHAVNSALKRFGMKRDIAVRGRLGFEVRWGPHGRIVPARLKAVVRWMTKLPRAGLNGTPVRSDQF